MAYLGEYIGVGWENEPSQRTPVNAYNLGIMEDGIKRLFAYLIAGGGTGSGKDGREVELRNSGEYIQWRYSGEEDWTNLVALADLKGKDGDNYVLTDEDIEEIASKVKVATSADKITYDDSKTQLGETNVQDAIGKLSEEKVDKIGLSLGQHTDGLIYIFIDGKPVGLGLNVSGGTVGELFDSWRGLISPMDGTFQQAYYNNGIAVGDKIYFMRNHGHSHYNGDDIFHTRWFCYDTKTNTTTYSTPTYDGKEFFCSSLWKGSDGAIYGFGYPYRYKTTDCGETWTRDEMTSPQYDPCPVYKLSSGRIIGTMLARTRMLMISDDEGLTWTTITPFTDEVFASVGLTSGTISMSHGTVCELDDCLALYFNSPMTVDNYSKRYVSLSYDNGDTWSVPVVCSGELAEAGYYLSAGGMAYFGNKYHYFVSHRYRELKYSEDENYYLIGDLKWFVGTADDVKNGTMKLKKVLSETLCTKNGFDAPMSYQDVGNSGVTLCDGALYVNHGNLVYNKDDETRVYVSNSGIEMFRIGLEDEEDVSPYWDANFAEKYNEMLAEKDTSFNYYFYSPDNTNINAVDWWGYEESGYLPNEGNFKLPLGTGDFEINGIMQSNNMTLSASFPRIRAGIERPDGTLHAIGDYGTNRGNIFDKANDNVPSGVLGGGSKTYFTFKRENGVDTYIINGVEVTNPPFGWTFETDKVVLGVEEPSFVYNINADDETVQTWLDSKPQSWNIKGFSMLTVSCDADYSGSTKDNSITYNLTNCTSSNTITGINDGRKYETTISVNDGYELESIACTMGGVAQTVTDGVISIESVTGDIVITAIAKEIVKDYTITYNLTDCTSSSTLPAIDEGEAYSTTILPISGYKFESITCTMGGVEQTVTDGVINITSVTGDIIITAKAVVIPPVTEPVTNGLVHWFDVTDISEDGTSWADKIGDMTLSTSEYNSETKIAKINGDQTLGNTSTLVSSQAMAFEIVVNSVGRPLVHSQYGTYDTDVMIEADYMMIGGKQYLGGGFYRNLQRHIICNVDYDNDLVELYVNGELRITANEDLTDANNRKWYLSTNAGNTYGNIRIYNRTLTAEEVENNYMYEQSTYTFDSVD